VVLGAISFALFFLEAYPLSNQKTLFLSLLSIAVFLIYTLDHLADGWKSKGKSGIHRYDFHFNNRKALLLICVLLLCISGYLIYTNIEIVFIQKGLYLIPLLGVYFLLKLRGYLKGLTKMLMISAIVSYVVVSLYTDGGFFTDFLSMERILMTLIAFMNQLVLEKFEFHENEPVTESDLGTFYELMIKRVGIWIGIFLTISTFLNTSSWRYTLSLLIITIMLWYISNTVWFKTDRRYRFFADFTLVLIWPILKLLMFISTF